MVKKRKNMMRRSLIRTIRRSMGRYIAIVAIIALGAGLFCGLRLTKVDMVATAQRYTDRQNMFDLQLMNSYGWTQEQVQSLLAENTVDEAEGSIRLDALLHFPGQDDQAYRMMTLPHRVNQVTLCAGRLPQAPDECILDNLYFDENVIGRTLQLSSANDSETLEQLSSREYTVVGLVSTPLYLNMQRGSTTIGSGSLKAFVYIPRDGFSLEYYTQIDLTLPGQHAIYSDSYNQAMDDAALALEPLALELANQRYDTIRSEAMEELSEGELEYLDGLKEYNQGQEDALMELADGRETLRQAEDTLLENRQKLLDGRNAIADGQATLDRNRLELDRSRKELNQAKADAYAQLEDAWAELDANHAQVVSGLEQVNDGLTQIDDGIAQIDDGIAQIDDGLSQIDRGIPQLEDALVQINDGLSQLEEGLPQLDQTISALQTVLELMDALSLGDSEGAQELKTQLDALLVQREGYLQQQSELIAQRDACQEQLTQLQSQKADLTVQREELTARKEELTVQREELLPVKAELENAMGQLQAGFRELEEGRALADEQFADAQAQLENGEAQLTQAQQLLNNERQALAEGEQALADGAKELAQGWREYHDAAYLAKAELALAKSQLDRGRRELDNGLAQLNELTEPKLYTLNRNTNLGYVVFENDSDIVAGIAKIFPVFFLAVAALVCVTTMSRMIDEERTQIGILKALGYSSPAIMGKYMAYSGSASILGCLLGPALGSTLFPAIIWKAYCIMYDIPEPLVHAYDIGTICFIFLTYTGLTLAVTWYCCRRELALVSAELIRPKPPITGQKILLERLPFWTGLKFLNKVALRNIFRYRQRLAMMLLGIGGCTALLVTGFGLEDSISDIVSYQFQQVTLYDIGVTFDGGLTNREQSDFRAEYPEQEILFCHQSSIDLEFDGQIKNVYFIASDQDLDGFIDLHTGETPLAMPGENRALISVGAASAMGIREGDTVTLRTADLEELTVTVTGIYDNHVHNFAIVSGDTLRSQWNRMPEIQSAFVVANDAPDLHLLGAELASHDGVPSLTINQDSADMVSGMMDALDSVIVLVVICAGALAAIVLYNLTNINIQERIREIATIKVLGFNASETASYVFKENLTLTVVGTLLGLVAGKWLHALVMGCVRIDMVWFSNRIDGASYLWSAVLTILAALLVDFVMYFRLEKINMAEALKSVE